MSVISGFALTTGLNGTVTKYPYRKADYINDNPGTSVVRQWFTGEALDAAASQGIFPVYSVARPAPSDPITKNVIEATPTWVNNQLTQTWAEEDASAAQIAERQKYEADETDRAVAIADSFVSQFLAMTPAQLNTYVNNNVTNLASARSVIAKLALMVLILGRGELRE